MGEASVSKATMHDAINRALEGRELLTHPFYRRWEAGELSAQELTAYAEQYRHFEAALPTLLRGILEQLPAGEARSLVEQNLADETGDPTHLELFDTFLAATSGAPGAGAGPAISNLLTTYGEVLSQGPAQAVSGLLAYETQAPDVARSKGDGLRKHYDFTEADTVFWDVHAELDVEHADWATQALARITDDTATVESSARRVADAWWSFLDERAAL